MPLLLFALLGLSAEAAEGQNAAAPVAADSALAEPGSPEPGNAEPVSSDSALVDPSTVDERSSWYVVELFGYRAGWAHVEVREIWERGERAIETRTEVLNQLSRSNGGQVETLTLTSESVWVESLAGEVLRLESRVDQGAGLVTTRLVPSGGTASGSIEGAQGARELQVPWDPPPLSPAQIDDELDRLRSGEREGVRFTTFSFEAGARPVVVHARVLHRGEDGSVLIQQRMEELGLVTEELYGAGGELLEQRVGPMVLRRSHRDQALAPLPGGLGAFRQLEVKLSTSIHRPRWLRKATYRLESREDEGSLTLQALFPNDSRQRVERDEGGREELTVFAGRGFEGSGPGEEDPAPELLEALQQPAALIESDDAEIAAVAEGVLEELRRELGEEPTDEEIAHSLELWVHQNVAFSGAGIGLASARRTLELKDGDCTENAVLLAALLRARGIPARLVVGLVAAGDPAKRLSPHAWVEAWVADGWLPLDAAMLYRKGEPVDATHLAMAKSTGAETSGLLELTAPLLSGLGRFDLELVSTVPPLPALRH
ncbi:MAG: transglutaminase-like domain-containing protein [Acidobacteriota bacterium]